MKIYKITYLIKETEKENKIKIFNPHFVRKYKKFCKLIYNGKVVPLKSEFIIEGKNQTILEFKLICFTNIPDISDIFKGCESFSDIKEVKNIKKDDYIYHNQLNYSIYQMSKMVYSIKPLQDKIKIFGKNFVNNNSDKCIIIYQDSVFSLNEFFLIQDIKNGGDKLEIILIELEDIYNRSYWFEDCEYLEEFSFISENNFDLKDDYNKKEKYFEDSENNFYLKDNYNKKEKYLKELDNADDIIKGEKVPEPEEIKKYKDFYFPVKIKEIKTEKNILNISSSFSGNNPNISFSPNKTRWNTCICKNMSYMFSGCKSLKLINGISNWDTQNVINMSGIFKKCFSLSVIPDISYWKTNNVSNMSEIFSGCSSLRSLPDISKWDITNVINISGLFSECSSLIGLPDISKWNTCKIFYLRNLFYKCSSLISIPDISKWNTCNIKNISNMFNSCSDLISLPDISKWNTCNITDCTGMFSRCHSLISLPDISKWKVTNIRCMRYRESIKSIH